MSTEDDDLIEHMITKQVNPQLKARELREKGVDADLAFVSTDPQAEGWTVSCHRCGRTATLPFDPGDKVGLCPDCLDQLG